MGLPAVTSALSRGGLALTGWLVQEPVLPVGPDLATMLPDGGLKPGSTISVLGSTSLLLSLAAEASAAGAWCAAVGFPALGAVAAAELGIDHERFVVVPDPGAQWANVASILFDGADLVLLQPPSAPNPADIRRLTARARERRVVLLCAGEWQGADLRLVSRRRQWDGLGVGHGHLATQEIEVSIEGRRSPRPRVAEVTLFPPSRVSP